MTRIDFSYEISEERLRAYARLSLLERLQWLDEVRLFTLMARQAETTGPAQRAATDRTPAEEP